MPTQTALSFRLPSTSSSKDLSKFTSFPSSLVTIKCILPLVKVMSSLMMPRLLQFMGSDNIPYQFLCKPKDDLQKDSRLIELFHFLNCMFCQDPEVCRQHLNIQTFAVVPLDHQCGLVEWVKNLEVFVAVSKAPIALMGSKACQMISSQA
ncbi:serine/threonine-protein kinase M1 [Entomophthora muscae]|uniref:Serine/threonine-protein kinase M1 n=1 Tax=Entomophthora muscae TaxID=34485 RepID=A0ACC2RXB0_9FUNG|nr:serine/threonine-protein kinase M1 [Entomophthora muscae]